MIISNEHNLARLAGSLAFLGEGAGHATIDIYTGPQPSAGGAVTSQVKLVRFTLDRPPGTMGASSLSITGAAVGFIVATGVPAWARWANGDGVWAGDSTASDELGSGEVKVNTDGLGQLLAGGGCALVSAVMT